MNMQVNVIDLCMCACVLQVRDRHVQELQTEILTKDGQLQQKDHQLQQKDRLFQQLRDEKDRNIQQKDQLIQEKDRQMEVELGPGLCFHEHHAISHLYM